MFAMNPGVRTMAGPVALIVAAVVAANILYLAGVLESSPLYSLAQIGTPTVAHLLPGLSTIDPNVGYTAQALGHRAALDILHGQMPWWNPFEGVGAPLAGEMQSAAFFPPTLLLAVSWGQLPFHMLLEVVAGIATYRLLLRLGLGRWIAAGGGCAFALNGTFSWFQHAPVNPIAFLPLMLLGVERVRDSALTGSRHRWTLIAVALALSLYAGFPETAYLDGLLVVAWALVRTSGLPRGRLLAYLRKLVMGGVVGLLLAAPILAAFAAYLRVGTLANHAANANLSALPREGLTSLFFPYAFGPIFGNVTPRTGILNLVWGQVGGYLSIALLALDAVALLGRRLRPLRVVLALWIVFTVGRAYGVEPFARLWGLLPAMDHILAYRYLPPTFELAAVVLAVLAIDDARRHAVPRLATATALAVAAVVAILAVYAGRPIFESLSTVPHHTAEAVGSVAWGVALFVMVGLALLVLKGRLRTGLLVACLVVDAGATFVVPELSAPRNVSLDTGLVTWLQRHDGLYRFYTLGPLQANYGSYFAISEADINDVPIPKRYGRYIDAELDTNVTRVNFTGVATINPAGPTPLEEFESHLAGYQAIGVAFLVASPGEVPIQVVRSLHLQKDYTDQIATVYGIPNPAPYYSVRSGSCSLSQKTVTSVVADCRTSATLVRQQDYMPGWSASENGHLVPVSSSGSLFQAVRLPPGTTTVEYSFVPPREGIALAALLVGLVLLLAGWWRTRLGSMLRLKHQNHEPPLELATTARSGT